MSGTKEDARVLNAYLSSLQAKVFDAHSELTKAGEVITAEVLKNKFLGRVEKPRMLIGIITDHNERMKTLVGEEYAPGTYKRFKVVHHHTVEFLKAKYMVSDYDIRKIDFAFVTDYEFHLRSVRKMGNNSTVKHMKMFRKIINICLNVTDYEFHLRSVRKMGNNSTVKHMKMFRKIINICLNNGWLTTDPFANYKGRYKNVDRSVLMEDEIAAKEFVSERLDQVRDTFLFCCFTGLAYADVQKLTTSQIGKGIDGLPWIFTQRTKTDTQLNIPLLPQAKRIMEKYANHPVCVNKGVLLPVPSNQKLNEYLKEIATLCGINKPVTSHIARHTFATTVALQNGIPIETLSKILGHKSIRTTQIYAKITDIKVSEDMLALSVRLKLCSKRA
jgi:site-specific recombinase XerD